MTALHSDSAHHLMSPADTTHHLESDHLPPTVADWNVNRVDVAEFSSRVDTTDWTPEQIRAAIVHERLHRAAGDE